jgi:hypothetical protein
LKDKQGLIENEMVSRVFIQISKQSEGQSEDLLSHRVDVTLVLIDDLNHTREQMKSFK